MAYLLLNDEIPPLLNAEITKFNVFLDSIWSFISSTFTQLFKTVTELIFGRYRTYIDNIAFSLKQEILRATTSLFGIFKYFIENTGTETNRIYDGYDIKNLQCIHN